MGNISNMSPFHTTGWKCFAESWACTTFPQEIDWDSGSIGHECRVVVSLGMGGVAFVLVWGCLCWEHLCWTRLGTLGGLWAWGVAFVGFLWFSGPLGMNGLGYGTMNGGGDVHFQGVSCTLYASRVGYSW